VLPQALVLVAMWYVVLVLLIGSNITRNNAKLKNVTDMVAFSDNYFQLWVSIILIALFYKPNITRIEQINYNCGHLVPVRAFYNKGRSFMSL
jgi:hypothetical protein